METCFLLTGKPRVGKSTAIKRIIQQIGSQYVGGFYTEEIRDNTDRIGFNCVTLNGETVRIASVDSESPLRVGRYGVDVDVFESVALKAVKQSIGTKKITVIDEIGFIQMLSPAFEEMVYDVISNTQHVVLGTICVHSHPSIDKIRNQPGVKLYHVNEANRDWITHILEKDMLRFV